MLKEISRKISNLSVMNSISLVGVLPVIAAIFFAGTIVFDKYAETAGLLKTEQALTNSAHQVYTVHGVVI